MELGKPYRSVLIPHLPLIRQARLERKTWQEIADEITRLGTKAGRVHVYQFFKRAQKQRIPLGFESPVPSLPPVAAARPESPAAPSAHVESEWRLDDRGRRINEYGRLVNELGEVVNEEGVVLPMRPIYIPSPPKEKMKLDLRGSHQMDQEP